MSRLARLGTGGVARGQRGVPNLWNAKCTDGSYMLKVPYSDDCELKMDLLRHGPEVEVEV